MYGIGSTPEGALTLTRLESRSHNVVGGHGPPSSPVEAVSPTPTAPLRPAVSVALLLSGGASGSTTLAVALRKVGPVQAAPPMQIREAFNTINEK